MGLSFKFLTGLNADQIYRIHSDKSVNNERKIVLSDELLFPIEVGDEVELTVGCDKQASTCRSKFQNMINFQGFPFIPGEDWMMTYPKPSSD